MDTRLTDERITNLLQQFNDEGFNDTTDDELMAALQEIWSYRKAAGEPDMYQYRFFGQEHDKWGEWHDCGRRDFEMFSADAQIPDSGVQVRRLYTSLQLAPVVLDALIWMRNMVSDPRALPRRKEWVSGQQYSYVLLENVQAMVEEACRACHAAMLASSSQEVTP